MVQELGMLATGVTEAYWDWETTPVPAAVACKWLCVSVYWIKLHLTNTTDMTSLFKTCLIDKSVVSVEFVGTQVNERFLILF